MIILIRQNKNIVSFIKTQLASAVKQVKLCMFPIRILLYVLLECIQGFHCVVGIQEWDVSSYLCLDHF